MIAKDGYLKIMAQKLARHKDNWQDNPNRYTAIFNIITPILSPAQRAEFNQEILNFIKDNYNLSPEVAEKIVTQNYFTNTKVYIRNRIKNHNGTFDTIQREWLNPLKLERGLRNLSLWLQIKFKEICEEEGINFEKDELSISDLQMGATSYI